LQRKKERKEKIGNWRKAKRHEDKLIFGIGIWMK
jgi:hypothetical protein